MRNLARFFIRMEWLWLSLLFPVVMVARSTGVFFLLLLPALWCARRLAERRFLPQTPLNYPLLLLMLMILVSTFVTFDLDFSYSKIANLLFGIGVYFAVVSFVGRADRRHLWLALSAFFVLGWGLSLISLLGTQWKQTVPFLTAITARLPQQLLTLPGAADGFNPNQLAGMLPWLLFPALSLAVSAWVWPREWEMEIRPFPPQLTRLLLSASALFFTGLLLLTQSRSGYVGLAGGLLLLSGAPLHRQSPRLAGWLLGTLILLGAGALLWLGPQTVFARMFAPIGVVTADFTSGVDSLSGRVEIWSRAVYAIQDFPITGLGLNNFRRVVHILYPLFGIAPSKDIAHAHNQLLQAGLDLGVLGLVAYLSIWIIAIGMVWSIWRQNGSVILRTLALGCGAGLLAHFIYGLTDAVALGSRPSFLFWFQLGIVTGLWQYQHNLSQSIHPTSKRKRVAYVPSCKLVRRISNSHSKLILLSVLLAFLLVSGRILPSIFQDNLTLVTCLNGFFNGSYDADSCEADTVTAKRRSTLAYLSLLTELEHTNQPSLSPDCTTAGCACDPKTAVSAKDALHERMENYFAVIAYQNQNRRFPNIAACADSLPASRYVLNQSIQAENEEQADVLWELAYLIDTDWENNWQRGFTAFKQAERYIAKGDQVAAEQAFGRAWQAFLTYEGLRAQSYLSRSLVALGELAFDKGELVLAEARFRESITISSQSGQQSFSGLLLLWHEQGFSMEEAVRKFVEIRRDLGEIDPYLTSGPAAALLERGKIDAAWNFIQSAPAEIQDTTPVLFVSGKVYEARQEFEKAEAAYLMIIVQTAERTPISAAIAARNLSRLYEAEGDIRNAIAQMGLATRLNPDAKWYWYRLSFLYQAAAEPDNACQAIGQALQIDPQNQTFLNLLINLDRYCVLN